MQAVASLRTRAPVTSQPISLAEPDAVLVGRIQSGDQGALAEAYALHGSAVFAAAYAVSRRRGLAEDVTQEIFVRLWKNSGRFNPERGGLRSFLKIDARGRVIDALRAEKARRDREQKDARLQSSTSGTGVEEEVMNSITSHAVHAALSTLRPEERTPLALAYFEGRSYREVAAMLDLPEGTVKSRIRTGLGRLRGVLQSAGVEAT